MLQAEFALTQVFDRPLSGRYVFEELIRENLRRDLGRPDRVSLIFNRRVTKRTPSRFNTRVITEGVMPSLHVSYKNSKIKQYFKEDKALRTEMTINNARDFAIGTFRNLRICPLCGRSALPPTDAYWTSKKFEGLGKQPFGQLIAEGFEQRKLTLAG